MSPYPAPLPQGASPDRPALRLLAVLVIANVITSTASQDALFLAHHPRSHIPPAMLLGSLLTAAAALGLARVLRRGAPATALRTILLLLGALSALLAVWNHRPSSASTFALFLFSELSTTLGPAATWTYFQAPLSAPEARRLLPNLGVFGGVGGLGAGALIPVLVRLSGPWLLLILSTVLWLAAAALVRTAHAPTVKPNRKSLGQGGLRRLSQVPLLRWMALATAALIWIGILVQYQTRVTLQRTQTPAEIAQTMGLLLALASVAGIFTQAVIATPILERWGVGPALLILPAAVVAMLLGYLLVPALTFLAAAYFIDKTLRPSLHRPAETCLLTALPPARRQPAFLALSGLVAPVAKAAGGLALVVLGSDYLSRHLLGGHLLTVLALLLGIGLALLGSRWSVLYSDTLGATLAEGSQVFAGGEDMGESASELPLIDGPRLQLLLQTLDNGSRRVRELALELLRPQRSGQVSRAMWERTAHPQEVVRIAAIRWLADEPTPELRALLWARWAEQKTPERERVAILAAARAYGDPAVLLGGDPRPWLSVDSLPLRQAAISALLGSSERRHRELGLQGVTALLLDPPTTAAKRQAGLALIDLEAPPLRLDPDTARVLLEGVLGCCADADLRVRREAVKRLPPFIIDANTPGAPAARAALFQALHDPATTQVAVRALGELGVAIVGEVVRRLEFAKGPARWALLRLLGQVPTRLVVPALLDTLRGPPERTAQLEALKSLIRLRRGDPALQPDPALLRAFLILDLRFGLHLRMALHVLHPRLRPKGLLRREISYQLDGAQQRVYRALALLSPADTVIHIFHALRNPSSPCRDQARELLHTLFHKEPALLAGSLKLLDSAERSGAPSIDDTAKWTEECFRPPLLVQAPGTPEAALTLLWQTGDPWLLSALRHDSDVQTLWPGPLPLAEDPMDNHIETILFLKDVALFEELSNQQLVEVARLAEPVHVQRGTVLFYQGDGPDYLYLVQKGKLLVVASGQEVARLGRGECAGEMAVLTGATRTATVEASEPCDLFRFESEDFLSLLSAYPEISRALLKSLVRRLAQIGHTKPGLRATITGMLDS